MPELTTVGTASLGDAPNTMFTVRAGVPARDALDFVCSRLQDIMEMSGAAAAGDGDLAGTLLVAIGVFAREAQAVAIDLLAASRNLDAMSGRIR